MCDLRSLIDPVQCYGRRRTEEIGEKSKYSFEGKLEISQQWFDIDVEWPETNFKTRELGF